MKIVSSRTLRHQTDEQTFAFLELISKPKADRRTKKNNCPKNTGHVMHYKMLLRIKQFTDLLICCTLITRFLTDWVQTPSRVSSQP